MLLLGVGNTTVAAGGYDTDAQAFFTASGITDTTQKNAVNTLVLAMKSASIWTKMKAVYPMVGGTSGTHAVNLKTPGTFNLTFVGSPTHSANGVDWNGTTQYAQTGLVPNTTLTKDAKAMGYYSRENTSAGVGNPCEMGCVGTSGSSFDGLFARVSGNLFGGYLSDLTGVTLANSDSSGFFIISRSNSTQVNFYRNGAALGTNPKTLNSVATQNTQEIELGRGNGQYSDRQSAFAFISDDLSSTNQSDFYTAVQAFQTSLSRQV